MHNDTLLVRTVQMAWMLEIWLRTTDSQAPYRWVSLPAPPDVAMSRLVKELGKAYPDLAFRTLGADPERRPVWVRSNASVDASPMRVIEARRVVR